MGAQPSKDHPLQFRIVTLKDEAQQHLDKAEQHDFYLQECYSNKTNAKARQSMNYRANSITYRELKLFEVVLENAMPHIPRRLKEDLREVLLIQLMPSADGGLPHTRPGSVICYPDLSRFLTTSTLIHELWHVHQRLYEQEWERIFQGLGWNRWEGYLPVSIDDHRRYNPDTIQAPLYIYENTWVPVPIFKDISRPELREVTIWFYHIHSKAHYKTVPDSLQRAFPSAPSSAYEHPRELTAYLLSEPDQYTDSPGFKKLVGLVGQLSIQP